MDDELKELDLQWQALRYAVDQIDIAWSYNPEDYEGDLYEQKREEMKAHREMLMKMQIDVLAKKHELKK